MEAITYSLYGNTAGTQEYYRDASAMADELIDKINGERTLKEFSRFTEDNGLESLDDLVYALEFVMIGVLFNKYGNRGSLLHKLGGKILARVYALKSTGKVARSVVEGLKGIVNTTLLPQKGRSSSVASFIDVKQFSKLIGWLHATGEFEQETKRLEVWACFFRGIPSRDSSRMLVSAVQLADWFENRSLELLGAYTCNVDSYIDNHQTRLKWKENQIFCARARVEYHLNMVGAELMNRAFHNDFVNTKEKRVLLPICMREKGEEQCRSVQTEHGYVCKGCAKDCQVNAITALGNHHNFKVYMIPHASTAFGHQHEDKGNTGIVGVACPLNLISGGYKAKELGYEPQCVLLNYCGCARHWHETGIVTNIELERLKTMLHVSDLS
ncbi:hypothetical protein FHR92_000693 [Fontibacillus solani]|uniref:DUF116 domain-containing protein n=1 Tax=Fontibacillus solani TaxID=1572857 RepID=A0A7W3SQK2_9BACL|nr:DUF116 domain-containing protein [Fontibacillus solani]MBA9084239.1 hypothetical protein [Fontibacillus solani]